MNAEKIKLYEATVRRLEEQIANFERNKKRLGWILLVSVLVAPMGWFVATWVVGAILLVGVSVFGCGHYLALMHFTEDSNALEEANEALRRLRAEVEPPLESPPPGT